LATELNLQRFRHEEVIFDPVELQDFSFKLLRFKILRNFSPICLTQLADMQEFIESAQKKVGVHIGSANVPTLSRFSRQSLP
jgi:hypothetical protein